MFIGHYAPALIAAAHPKAPRLGTLFVAAQLVDIAFFAFLPLGIEKMRFVPGTTVMNPMDLYHMPYTHSLVGSIVWGAAFAGLVWLWLRNWTPALIAGGVVVSHWFIDLIVHAKDLTLFGAPPKLGFGLWDYPGVAMPLEFAITFAALWYYTANRPAVKTTAAVPALVLFLFIVQLVDWFGPKPQVVDAAITIMGLSSFGVAALLAVWVGNGRARGLN
jgi:membrane-bound metal-dependent hydrolase YbcI (DUF457 family)